MTDELTCLNHRDGTCDGEVLMRESLTGTGRAIARCDVHWRRRLDSQRANSLRYPMNAPNDFDPAYAGESWDDE